MLNPEEEPLLKGLLLRYGVHWRRKSYEILENKNKTKTKRKR